MMFQWTDATGETRQIIFDTSDDESHDSNIVVTEHPVEDGTTISDHIIRGNDVVQLRATVSNTPIRTPESHARGAQGEVSSIALGPLSRSQLARGAQGGSPAQYEDVLEEHAADVLQFSSAFDRVRDVYQELKDLQDQGQTFSLITSLRTRDNCVLSSLTAPRSADHGNSIEFVMSVTQIQKAESQIVAAPEPQQPRGRQQQSRGSQNATATEEEAPDNRTAAARLLDFATENLQ